MNIFDLHKKPADAGSEGSDPAGQNADTSPAMPHDEPPASEKDMAVEALYQIIDPELGINVIDLGLVYEMRISPEEVYVQMTMTTPGCPMHESIVNAAERALKMLFPLKTVNIHLVWEPAWTPERLSPSAKQKLGFR